jgi:hypothetical protein
MLTVFFDFLCPPLANLAFCFERNDFAAISYDFVSVRTVIGATIAARGHTSRRD